MKCQNGKEEKLVESANPTNRKGKATVVYKEKTKSGTQAKSMVYRPKKNDTGQSSGPNGKLD